MAKFCSIEGCDKESRPGREAICPMHYHRRYRTGSTVQAPKMYTPRMDTSGYLCYGTERIHRIVYRLAVGDNVPPCWKCGMGLSWDMGKRMHIDHINEVKTDNRVENLRASCFQCNLKRSPAGGQKLLKAKGMAMPIKEWLLRGDVCVSYSTILQRLKRGMTDHDALFSPRKTRPN